MTVVLIAVISAILTAVAVSSSATAKPPRVRAARSSIEHELLRITTLRRASPSSRGSTFLSVFPACGCSRRTVIEQFSLSTGKPLRALARISLNDAEISAAAADASGDLWFTATAGPALSSPGTAGGGPEPDTCAGSLYRYDPASGVTHLIRSFPSSVAVGNAVPSPDGQRVAVLEGGCGTSFFNQHIVIIDLRTSAQIQIGADVAPCHALFNVAWNANGSQLIFPYGPSILPRDTTFVPRGTCDEPEWNRLAVVPAEHASQSSSWKLMKAESHCSYQSAAFDPEGIVATEGCTTGAPADQPNNPNSGIAKLVQLDTRGRVEERVPLRIAYEGGDVVADPRNHEVLISEDEGGNLGVRYYQWVWAFDGHRLRVIGHYPGQGATIVLAQPW
jgi:hypothetical protein